MALRQWMRKDCQHHRLKIFFCVAIPEDAIKEEPDDEDSINPDERNPQSLQDKRIIGENEFSESDDEGSVSNNRKDNRLVLYYVI